MILIVKHCKQCKSLLKGEGGCWCQQDDDNCNWCFACSCKAEERKRINDSQNA